MSRHTFKFAGRLWLTQLILLAALALPRAHSANLINLSVENDGIYQVSFSDLTALLEPIAVSRLQILEKGQPIPFAVMSDDEIFGVGDSLEFVGYRPQLGDGWHGEYPRQNVYQLSILPSDQIAIRETPLKLKGPAVTHLEEDLIRVALPKAKTSGLTDRWYWQRISCIKRIILQK